MLNIIPSRKTLNKAMKPILAHNITFENDSIRSLLKIKKLSVDDCPLTSSSSSLPANNHKKK